MKKSLISILLCLLLILPLSAFDWGGRLSTTTKMQGQLPKQQGIQFPSVSENAKLNLWFTTPIGKSLKFATDISYTFRFNQNLRDGKSNPSFKNILDVDLMKLSGLFNIGSKNTLEFGIGRFGVGDYTGIIINQINCGGFINFSMPRVSFNLYAGGTGLVNAHSVIMLNRETTTSLAPEFNKYPYYLAPFYLPIGFSTTVTPLFLNQNLTAEIWAVLDLSGEKNNGGIKYNRFYGTLALDGAIIPNLYYNVSATLGSEDFKNVSNLLKFNIAWYPVQEATAKFYFVYASGKNGALSPFRGFTAQSAVFATESQDFNSLYSSKIKFGLQGSYTFISRILVAADIAPVFACNEKVSYNGLELSLNATYNIFSDLQVALSLQQYIGKKAENNKTAISLTGTLVF